MSANTSPASVSTPSRPPTVDYAVYALIARCVFALGAAFALYGARDEVTRQLADANKNKHWTAADLHHNVDAFLRGKVINAVVTIVVVAILVKFIREGRAWARLLYLAFAVLVAGDLFSVLGFFEYHDFLARTLTGLVGLSSIAVLVLLFLPDSNAYFRPAGAGGGLLGSMFRPRGLAGAGNRPGPETQPAQTGSATRPAVDPGIRPARNRTTPAQVVPAGEAAATEAIASSSAALPADRRPAPRGKSRQAGTPRRGGHR